MSRIYKVFLERKDAIRRTVAKYRPNPADVEELTQETFLKAFAAEQSQDIKEPENFVLTIAKRVAINAAQKKAVNASESVEDSGGLSVIVDERQLSPESQLDARRKLYVMSQAVANLKPEVARVFLMRRIEGLKYKQIATRLNISVSLAEKRVATAMVDCLLFLRKNGYDPADFGIKPKSSAPKKDASSLRHATGKVEDGQDS